MMTLGPGTTMPRLTDGQELLDGRLVIHGVLGAGNMGVVYRAEDRAFGRQVALKTLTNFDADRLYQLKREFRTLERLSHANLVRLYWLGSTDGLWFLTMELIEGVELTAWRRLQRPSQERVRRVFGQLAEALRALHAAGLMHRDVKPSNVMVTPDDHAVLLDFGLTAPIRRTDETLAAGTLDYIAPEQLWNESPGAAADWYSFGVVLYEALTGALPFAGPDRLRAMSLPLQTGPRDLVADVPSDLDALVRRLLDPDPRGRPNADDLAVVFTLAPNSASMFVLPEVPFVGRDEARGRLHAHLAAARANDAQIVHVHGPSGIGKTALARRFVTEARASTDVLVLEGRCHPQESVPFNALDALIDNLAGHLLGVDTQTVVALAPRHAAALLHLFPVLGRVPAVRNWPASDTTLSLSELRRHGSAALRELLGKLADRQSLVLWIDDIQWSDADSGDILRTVLAPPDAPRLLLLLTAQDDEAESPLLAALRHSVTPADIALPPLSRAESAQLLHTLSRDDRIATASALADDAGGSPFLLNEIVRYLDANRGPSAVVAPTIAEVMRARFSPLTADERGLMNVVSIAGRPLDIDLALEAAGLGAGGRLLAYSLCGDDLLRITTHDRQDFLEPYHDRLRESALAAMSPGEAEAQHRRLASAIRRSRHPDPGALVGHYLAAGDSAEALQFALLAAEEAERNLAFDQAVAMYDVVIAHGSPAGPTLLERRAVVLANAARRREAALAYLAAADLIDEVGARTALRTQAAEQYFYGGELQRGLAVLENVLLELGIRVPGRPLMRSVGAQWRRLRFIARGPALVTRRAEEIAPATRVRLDALWRITRGVVMLDPGLADVLAGTHLLESLRCGDASRALRALGLEAAFEANIGGRWFRERSRRLLTTAERAAAEGDGGYDIAWLAHCRAACAWFEGRWRDCVRLGEDADRLLRETGLVVTWELTVLRGFILSALAHLGRLDELSKTLSELVADAERRDDQYALRVFRTGDAVFDWLARDRPEEALVIADNTLQDYLPTQFTSQHRHHLVATVQTHLYAGEGDRAWERVETAWPALRWSGFLLLDCLGTQLRYLRACAALAMARRDGAHAGGFVTVARQQARRIRRSTLPMSAPMAHAVEAGIAAVEHRRDAQIAALRASSHGFGVADMALHRAAVQWQLSALTAEDGGNPAAAWMAARHIVRPAAMARAVVPIG